SDFAGRKVIVVGGGNSGALLRDTVERYGSADVDRDYPLLRALLMGAVVGVLLPGAPMPVARLRAELFHRYGLAWDSGMPPDGML
ncbi:hypothetical protein ACFW57_37840, partial [Streptomyces sp. NPDC058757]